MRRISKLALIVATLGLANVGFAGTIHHEKPPVLLKTATSVQCCQYEVDLYNNTAYPFYMDALYSDGTEYQWLQYPGYYPIAVPCGEGLTLSAFTSPDYDPLSLYQSQTFYGYGNFVLSAYSANKANTALKSH